MCNVPCSTDSHEMQISFIRNFCNSCCVHVMTMLPMNLSCSPALSMLYASTFEKGFLQQSLHTVACAQGSGFWKD